MTKNIVRQLKLPEGCSVESVFYGSGTLCISTQAGCHMACPFCASGRAGLMRNLSVQELEAQVELYPDIEIKRITLSGIGEPLSNLENVEHFISESKYPVSLTTSVPDASLLKKIIKLKHNGVMLSLHAGSFETHKKLIPKSDSLNLIFEAMTDIWGEISGNRKRKIGFNYLLFDGINDTDEEISAFIGKMLQFKEATVHLLLCNHVERSRFRSPDIDLFQEIYEKMRDAGLNVRRANNWRKEAEGGCGTLFLKTLQK
ncbi:MAG: hypothetical protein C0602_12610 [Denitrovibrio sp.]|nr:MAG: hypothetical protein C0602_12610 [Denitrovibrio sp.]